MPRVTDPEKIERARQLELSGLSREDIAAEMGVSPRTVSRWLGPLPPGRPRLPEGEGSRWTQRRRRGEGSGTA